jgi:hypothetical protein
MKKGCVAFLFFLFGALSIARAQTVTGKPVRFEAIVNSSPDGYAAETLYITALKWVNRTFGSDQLALQVQDEKACIIVGKGTYSLDLGDGAIQDFNFLLKLQFNRGSVRYTLSDFAYKIGNMPITDGKLIMKGKGSAMAEKHYEAAQVGTLGFAMLLERNISEFLNIPIWKNGKSF